MNCRASNLKLEPPTCRSPEEILKLLVPSLIWEATIASGFNATNPVTIGTTIDFICPEGTAKDKLSKDDDRFTYNDDKYTILCSTNRYWLVGALPNLKICEISRHPTFRKVPREWPTCVPSCWMRLPVPPPHSGLEAVVPTNTIPVGQHGKYVCKDRYSIGMICPILMQFANCFMLLIMRLNFTMLIGL